MKKEKLYRTSFLIFLIISFSCAEYITEAPADSGPFERWRSYELHNYTLEQVRQCFCINGGQKMKVIVRADTVMQVIRLSDNTELNPSESKWYLTVDSLFSIIRHSTKDSLVVTYSNKYGYPEKLDINPQLHPVDGGVLYISSNLIIP